MKRACVFVALAVGGCKLPLSIYGPPLHMRAYEISTSRYDAPLKDKEVPVIIGLIEPCYDFDPNKFHVDTEVNQAEKKVTLRAWREAKIPGELCAEDSPLQPLANTEFTPSSSGVWTLVYDNMEKGAPISISITVFDEPPPPEAEEPKASESDESSLSETLTATLEVPASVAE